MQDTSRSGNDRTWLTRNSSPLFNPNKMLKQSASDVLASFRPSTCPRWYALALHSHGPADEFFEHPVRSVLLSQTCRPLDFRRAGFVFPQPARIRKFSLTQAMLAEKRMTGSHRGLRRIAMRDWRDGRNEVGIISVHVAPFSPISRFTRHGLWHQRIFSVSC